MLTKDLKSIKKLAMIVRTTLLRVRVILFTKNLKSVKISTAIVSVSMATKRLLT
jgi:hypothetical protein